MNKTMNGGFWDVPWSDLLWYGGMTVVFILLAAAWASR